ncbi:MAG: hypothetical protein GY859_04230, partial [Desulfobacterales bacterium]|nr:hypothetical protein [Desulfobacterales bacterium]
VKAVACRGAMDLEVKDPGRALGREMETPLPASPEKGAPGKTDAPEAELMIRDIPFGGFAALDADSFPDADRLAMDLGVDPTAAKAMIHWAVNLFEKEVITAKETDGLDLSRDNPRAAPELIRQIAARRGLGAVLAEGPLRAAKKIGRGSIDHFTPVQLLIKLHTEDAPDRVARSQGPAPVSAPNQAHEYKGAPGSISWLQLNEILYDCLGIGDDRDPLRLAGRDGFRPAANLIELNTGLRFDENELRDAAYRCHAAERLFDIRESAGAPPEFFFDAPSWFGMAEPMWENIDLPKFKFFAAQYHQVEGWDKESLLNKTVLEKLELGDMWPTRR